MSKKKSSVPDDIMYKDFNLACPYRARTKSVKPIDAYIRCKDDQTDKKHGYPSHCPNCGWNPDVTKRRLIDMVGEPMALKLIEQSEKLAAETEKAIMNGEFAYV